MSGNLTHNPNSNAPQPPAPLTPEQVTAYLDWFLIELVNKRDDELLPKLAALAKLARIEDGDEDTAGRIAEDQRIARALIATVEARRKEAKEPYLNGGRAVDAWKNRYEAVVIAALAPVDAMMLDYGNRKAAAERRRREEAARKAQEEADRAADEAARAVREAEAAKPMQHKAPVDHAAVSNAIEEADRTANKADAAQREAQAPAATMGRTRGIYGATSAPKTTWEWEVIDASKIPRSFLTVDEDKVKAAARERDPNTRRPLAIIPGIGWVEYRTVGTAKQRVS